MSEWYRLAVPEDSDAVLAIYRPYIEKTTVTFECTVPSPEAFRKRVETISATYPYIVHETDGTVDAYAYATQYGEREAYRFSVSLSIYLDASLRGRGLGPRLYSRLLALLPTMGIRMAYGLIAQPNESSNRLHERLGFTRAGLFRNMGNKFGKWLDVLFMEKSLLECDDNPQHPRSIHDLDPALIEAVLAGE